MQPDRASVFSVFPRDTSSCSIATYTLVPEPPTTEKSIRHWDRNIEILHGAIHEDGHGRINPARAFERRQ